MTDFPKKVVVIGAGGFGRECAEICKIQFLHSRDVALLGYLDDNKELWDTYLNGDKVLGGLDYFKNNPSKIYFVCGVGDSKKRKEITEKALNIGYKPITLIHPRTTISTGVKIGQGTVIQAGSLLAINCTLGDHVHLNYNCIIGHDAKVDNYVTFAPTAQIMGNTYIKEGSYIGGNAFIKQGITVGSNTVIGALSFVNKDIPDNIVAIGIPVKKLKENK